MEDYCKAIEEAKLPEKTYGSRANASCYYDEQRLIDFVDSDIDIRDMRQQMADFTQSSDVAQALHAIRTGLQSGLQQRITGVGTLFQVGSFYDGSKTGRLNEMDCLYVISESDVEVQQVTSGNGHFRVYVQGREIKPRDMNKKLAIAMKETLSEMSLPDGWTHGGYASEEFSGVRCNGPAVTAMFCNKNEKHISLDVSIVYPLTSQLQQRPDFPPQLREHCRCLADSFSRIQSELTSTQISGDLQLIGNLVHNTWQPTTALAEAEILRGLRPECSVKRALDICKGIASKLQTWYEKHITRELKDECEQLSTKTALLPESYREVTLTDLYRYNGARPDSKIQIRDRLNTNMTYQHIWLSAKDRQYYKEVLKAIASINTAAMKHIILKTALQMKGAFSAKSKTHSYCLVRAVFEDLADTESVYTQHAFLHGVELPKFSLSVTLSHIKEFVARGLQYQCKLILDRSLKKNKFQNIPQPKRNHDSDVGDYCYKFAITLAGNGCCSVSDAEQMAVVISAMMNTSGGVLEIQIDTGYQRPGSSCETKTKEFGSHLLSMITTQERWISKHLVSSYLKQCVQEKSSKILFFVNKANYVVTHCTNAYILDSGDVKLITDNDVICRLLRECSCKGEDRCTHHKDRPPELQSVLTDINQLNIDALLPHEWSTQYLICRYYKLNGRPLAEVLYTQSVSNDIKELVSALANTDGGSILVGVTCTHTPVVKGYALGDISIQQLSQCFSHVINGQGGNDIAIWSTEKLAHEHWKLFLHPVSGSGDYGERHVIEIRVRKCPGGMFLSMPLCYEASHSGDIVLLKTFEEWKEKMLLIYKPESGEANEKLEDHFSENVEGPDLPSDVELQGKQISKMSGTTVKNKEPRISHVFQWWLAHNGDVASESLSFDHCCARELAGDAIDIEKPFMFCPSVQTVMEQYKNAADIHSALIEIEQKYREDNGTGVIIENMADYLPGGLLDIVPNHHVFDIIVLKTNCRPSVITVLSKDSVKAAAEHYNRTLVCLLKRFCLLTYRHLCDSTTYLCFQCQLYFVGRGFDSVAEKVNYPQEYLRPTMGTLDIVRYSLADILLHIEPLRDRFGDIMVRHLSAIQAKLLWEKKTKVTVIEGKAGSGKSVLALESMRRIKQTKNGQSKIAFLCPGRGLAAYIKYQTEMIGICVDIKTLQPETMQEMSEEYFSQYSDVFIDDAHAIPLKGEPNWHEMYKALFASLQEPNSHACILLDPDMQDYRGCIPMNFSKEIQTMARKYPFIRRQDVKTKTLGKILRNSTRICKFIGVNLLNEVDELRNIRNLPEDGVYLYITDDMVKRKELFLRQGDEKYGENAKKERDHNEEEEPEDEGECEDRKENASHGNSCGAGATVKKETLVSRLGDLLKGNRYQERHITIVTECTDDKTWLQEILRCTKYPIQDATTFPVKHIVVDTLENFEGLESPVILFIVPRSWGTGYVGSLKYRLCISTRAISRLEFLVPWDPTGREEDLEDLRRAFQAKPPVDYGSLRVTCELSIEAWSEMRGMCYFSGRLFATEWRKEAGSNRLAVYSVTNGYTWYTAKLLHTLDLDLDGEASLLRVDHQSGWVYIPCNNHGVCVVKYDGSKLVPLTTLRCVENAKRLLTVVSPGTLYVFDWANDAVCLVDFIQDKVTAKLQAPLEVRGERPCHIAALADTVLVVYEGPMLVTYQHGVPTSGTVLSNPHGLLSVSGLTTDHHSSFLLLEPRPTTVYVLDISGSLSRTIAIPGYGSPLDCAVVGGQLWIGYDNGDIIVMSSH